MTDTRYDNATRTELSSLLPQPVQSLICWPVVQEFSPAAAYVSHIPSPLSQERTSGYANMMDPRANTRLTMSHERCMALVERYLDNCNLETPILDPNHLRQLVSEAYLSKFRLSVESCLALLVCANGAISTHFASDVESTYTSEITLADTLFFFAEQRLGMAFTTGSVTGAQALYLCGSFHMFRLRAFEAWQMYSAALRMAQRFPPVLNSSTHLLVEPDLLSLQMRVYWSSWKSESDLRWELGLRDFEGRAINYPSLSPSPPKDGHAGQVRSWFFHLSQISFWSFHYTAEHDLHKLAHKIVARTWDELISGFYDFERQLANWQQTIAPGSQIGNLDEVMDFGDDMLTHVLEAQVSNYYELITWPFISAAVKDKERPSEECKALVGKGLYWHVRRLRIYTPIFYHRHNGTWLMQRRCIRSALVLLAAALIHDIVDLMPPDWQDDIHAVVIMLRRWSVEICDAGHYADLLVSLLEKCSQQGR